ncbi:irregular chiasm C-roughest protein-like [Uranotaenia lowii]|uniref:irregular chiasm C-roughest protein-like n=1 Tax=Uranotaenia lowii TaxID=190385 RepID=UPI002479F193|nr:irregular chiasm C-roughest protein-like [Uranotaenia lowii]
MSQMEKLVIEIRSTENRHREEKSGRSQSWSKRRRRRRKWISLLSICSAAIPFRYFYLFLLLRVAILSGRDGGGGGVLAAKSSNTDSKGHGQPQRFAMEPQDQTAVVGSRVTLPCRVVNKLGQLQWTKDDFGLGTHRNLSGFERYSMVGSDDEGDFSLDIFPVMLDDDAKYQCQVGPGKRGTPGIRSRFATLMVLVPPEPPKIVQGDFMVTTEDREVELECVSAGGRPAAEITWIDGLGNVLMDGIEYMKESLPDARRFTAKSILKLIPKREHHNTTLTCQAQNTADRTERSVHLKLEVKYAPKVTIEVTSGRPGSGDSTQRIVEGMDVRLRCKAEANPPEVTFRWYVGHEMMTGDFATELVIYNISRKHHEMIVKCEARNVVGKSEESETLDIGYGPLFRSLPKSVEADLDTVVTLSCDVDGNPSPDIVWVHEESGRIMSASSNLTMTATVATAGRYICKATVLDFPEIEAEATVYLRGPPSISSPRQQFGTITDTGRLECEAFSVPKAKHIIWVHNGREINTSHSDGQYSIVESFQPEGVKSTLIIHNSQREHFGGYNCTVINDYGVDYVEIDFVSRDNLLLPVIIFGFLGGVTLLIIVIAVAMCLWGRKGHKKLLPPADVIPKQHISDKDSKELLDRRASNVSDLKIDRDNEFMETSLGPDGMTTQVNLVLGTSATIAKNGSDGSGPVPASVTPVGKVSSDYRYSGDYTDSLSRLSSKGGTGTNNNGYLADYSHRDFSSPTAHLIQFRSSTSSTNISSSLSSQNHISNAMTLGRHRKPETARLDNATLPSIQGSLSTLPNGAMKQSLLQSQLALDQRYGGSYGSPYLRAAAVINSMSPPMPPATANPAATPAPPPYSSAASRSALLFGTAAMPSPVGGISPGTAPGGPTTGSNSPSSVQSSSISLSQSSHQSNHPLAGLPSNAVTKSGSGGATAANNPPQPGSPSSSSGQFILPSSGSIKQQGATHV